MEKIIYSGFSGFSFKFIYFMCMSVFLQCMFVHCVHARCPRKSNKVIQSPRVGVRDSGEEQQVLVAAEPSLQPQFRVCSVFVLKLRLNFELNCKDSNVW